MILVGAPAETIADNICFEDRQRMEHDGFDEGVIDADPGPLWCARSQCRFLTCGRDISRGLCESRHARLYAARLRKRRTFAGNVENWIRRPTDVAVAVCARLSTDHDRVAATKKLSNAALMRLLAICAPRSRG